LLIIQVTTTLGTPLNLKSHRTT